MYTFLILSQVVIFVATLDSFKVNHIKKEIVVEGYRQSIDKKNAYLIIVGQCTLFMLVYVKNIKKTY